MTKKQAIRRFKRACVEYIKRHGTIGVQAGDDGLYTIDGGHKLTQAEVSDIVSDAFDKL